MATTLRQRLLALVNRREYSVAEARAKLEPHCEDDHAALDALIADFVERGWLSDERFARAWVHSRQSRYGASRLRAELRIKGVADELIDATLAEASEAGAEDAGNSEFDRARALWQRRFSTTPADQKERARQVRYLASRGFALGIAYRVVGGEEHEDDV
ncbi:regulatory protein RecX [Chitinibacteraceae bacterium HSL-7]